MRFQMLGLMCSIFLESWWPTVSRVRRQKRNDVWLFLHSQTSQIQPQPDEYPRQVQLNEGERKMRKEEEPVILSKGCRIYCKLSMDFMLIVKVNLTYCEYIWRMFLHPPPPPFFWWSGEWVQYVDRVFCDFCPARMSADTSCGWDW